MKKTLLVILALVMALTMVMGSVSTVSAAPLPSYGNGTIYYTVPTIPTNSYGVDVTGMWWQNAHPAKIQILLTGTRTDGGNAYVGTFDVPKGADSKYPQNYEINMGVATNIFVNGSSFTVTVIYLDRKGNQLWASIPNQYYWGNGGD